MQPQSPQSLSPTFRVGQSIPRAVKNAASMEESNNQSEHTTSGYTPTSIAYPRAYRLVLVGGAGVGKTCLRVQVS